MSSDGTEFTPEQVEHQIDMLIQSQEPWSDPSSDTRLISELYQVYTEDDATIENVWQSLAERVKSTRSQSVAENVPFQPRSRMDMLPERQEEPQRMNIKVTEKRPPNTIIRLLEMCATLLVVAALVAGTAMLIGSTHQKPMPGLSHEESHVPPTATSTATETPTSTILFSDPLNTNIHHWPTASNDSYQYLFKDNAYHLRNEGVNSVAAVCPQNFPETTLSYQITMEEITGDDTSTTNTFGIILNYHEQTVKGTKEESFYVFEILNMGASSQYGFYKYDNSKPNPWIQIGKSMKTSKELHGGHGAHAVNVVKVVEDAGSFTFYVNGQQVGRAKDGSLKAGSVGMLVNLKGTEVAFSNLLITRP